MRQLLATLARIACDSATYESTTEQLCYLSDLSDAYAMAGELS